MANAVIETGPADTTSWTTLLQFPNNDENDTSGRLQGVGVVQGHSATHRIRITLDSNTVVSDKLTSSFTEYGNAGMTLNLPFESSIEVEIRDVFHARARPRFWVSLVID